MTSNGVDELSSSFGSIWLKGGGAFFNNSTREPSTRGIVYSQIGYTEFKSSKKFLVFSDSNFFDFFRIFWIFLGFFGFFSDFLGFSRIFWIFSDFGILLGFLEFWIFSRFFWVYEDFMNKKGFKH